MLIKRPDFHVIISRWQHILKFEENWNWRHFAEKHTKNLTQNNVDYHWFEINPNYFWSKCFLHFTSHNDATKQPNLPKEMYNEDGITKHTIFLLLMLLIWQER